MKDMMVGAKSFDLKELGVEISPEMLAKINNYTLKPLTADDVYVRKYLLAHNGIDRDNERFPEDLLNDFMTTLPGKSFLKNHDKNSLPIGRFFNAATETFAPDFFKELTGEEISLPDTVTAAKVLWGWVYMLKSDFNNELITNIDGGIYRHASIGFRATDLVAQKADINSAVQYWQYVAPGEATESSIVWLGAQPGAMAVKKIKESSKEEGGKSMDLQKVSKAFGRAVTEETIAEVHTQIISEKDAELGTLNTQVGALNTEVSGLKAQVSALQPLAEEGKAFRDDLIKQYHTLKVKVEDVKETLEAKASLEAIAKAYPVEFLRDEIKILNERVAVKFPDRDQLKGDARQDKSGDSGKKNVLVPDEK